MSETIARDVVMNMIEFMQQEKEKLIADHVSVDMDEVLEHVQDIISEKSWNALLNEYGAFEIVEDEQ